MPSWPDAAREPKVEEPLWIPTNPSDPFAQNQKLLQIHAPGFLTKDGRPTGERVSRSWVRLLVAFCQSCGFFEPPTPSFIPPRILTPSNQTTYHLLLDKFQKSCILVVYFRHSATVPS